MPAPLTQDWMNIAVLDDDPTYRTYISAVVARQKGFVPHVVSTYAELEALLQSGYIDCILLDYDLGDESGLLVRQRLAERFDHLPPVILLTGDERQSTVIKALRAGVSDFLPKLALTPGLLSASIARAIESHKEDKRAKTELKRLSDASVRDALTGLATRKILEARLSHFANSGTSFYNGIIIGVSIEDFASIDEAFGKAESDSVVKAFAQKLQASLKSTDLCGRYSDDTFLIINHADAGVDARCEELRKAVSFRADLKAMSLNLSAHVRSMTREEAERLTPQKTRTAANDRSLAERDISTATVRSEDRRKEVRTRVFKRGQMIVSGIATIDCTIRNISDHGAGIRLDTPFAAPKTFELHIGGAPASHSVEVKWQSGRDLGVAFLD